MEKEQVRYRLGGAEMHLARRHYLDIKERDIRSLYVAGSALSKLVQLLHEVARSLAPLTDAVARHEWTAACVLLKYSD